jgi:hypothetical protein
VRGIRTSKEVVLGTGGGIAGVVYGTIVMMAVVAAGSRIGKTDPWRLAVFAVATVLVVWIAHVYAHALSDSIAAGRRLEWAELRSLAWREASLLAAAAAPVGALVLGALGAMAEERSIRLALGIGVATLAAQGVRYTRVERLGRTATLLAVAVNVALGLVIVALEVVLAH